MHHYLANCSFDIFSKADLFARVVPIPEADFLSKNTEARYPSFWYPSYFVFLAILDALSLNTLS